MHPDDVAALVAEEFGVLETELRGWAGVGPVTLVEPTLITVGFTARAYESALVGSGLVVAGPAGMQQAAQRIPILGARPRGLVLRVICDGWDGRPPEFDLRYPDGRALAEWPKGTDNGGIARGHPKYDRPFFCRPGTREFHTHPVHADDPWDKHREGFTLAAITMGILDDLLHRWTMG